MPSINTKMRQHKPSGDRVHQDVAAGDDADDAHKELPAPRRVIDEHRDDFSDAADEPVKAQQCDQKLIGVGFRLCRRPEQDTADDQGRNAHHQRQPPGALFRLYCRSCHDVLSLLKIGETITFAQHGHRFTVGTHSDYTIGGVKKNSAPHLST